MNWGSNQQSHSRLLACGDTKIATAIPGAILGCVDLDVRNDGDITA
jgi:hypothetical protein